MFRWMLGLLSQWVGYCSELSRVLGSLGGSLIGWLVGPLGSLLGRSFGGSLGVSPAGPMGGVQGVL